MSNAVGTIVYSDVPGFPAGSVVDRIEMVLMDASLSNLEDTPSSAQSAINAN